MHRLFPALLLACIIGLLTACATPGERPAVNDVTGPVLTPTKPVGATSIPKSTPSQAVPDSGITGLVSIGPNCGGPVKKDDTGCAEKPYQAEIEILDTAGKQVTTVQSDTDGKFKVSLAPGTYTLHPKTNSVYPTAADQTVSVTAGQYSEVKIAYDTGMR